MSTGHRDAAKELVFLSDDSGRVEVPMDHPLVKALNKAVREKQEARERANPPVYVDPRDLPPMGAA